MPAEREDWTRAYAVQALSDLEIYEMLGSPGVAKCHRLHFLQMAAEKVCKAHLTSDGGHENVRKTHAVIARILPIIARFFYASIHDSNQPQPWQMRQFERFAREIEFLSPACDAGGTRQDNTEYPWLDGHGDVKTPCEYRFPGLNDGERPMVSLVLLIRAAAKTYVKSGS